MSGQKVNRAAEKAFSPKRNRTTVKTRDNDMNYAGLLMEALMHDPETLNLLFPESFIYFKPKDVVSGDFFWFEEVGGKTVVACADATGHGVPGAVLSVLGINKLHEAVKNSNCCSAGQILTCLNRSVYTALGKKHAGKLVLDGFDISLFCIDRQNMTLSYSGAINPLFIVRKGELITLEADRFGIGYMPDVSYTEKTISLEHGDMIYSFSDGYISQFGGERARKFGSRMFKELLTEISACDTSKQKTLLDLRFREWKGDLEQTDDVCVVGVRIN